MSYDFHEHHLPDLPPERTSAVVKVFRALALLAALGGTALWAMTPSCSDGRSCWAVQQ